MKVSSKQEGFGLIQVVLTLALITFVCVAGWAVYRHSRSNVTFGGANAEQKQGRKVFYVNVSVSIGSSCFYHLLSEDGKTLNSDICVKNEDVERIRKNLRADQRTSTIGYLKVDADVHYGKEQYYRMDQNNTAYTRTTMYIDRVYSVDAYNDAPE